MSLKRRARGLSEAQFVIAVAESISLGARCWTTWVARGDSAQEQLRGFTVPAPQTAGNWLRRFTLGHLCHLNKALAQVQRDAFRAAGVTAVTLDFDSTYLFSRSKRRQGRTAPTRRATPCTPCSALTPARVPPCTPDASRPSGCLDRDEDLPRRDAAPGTSGRHRAGSLRLGFLRGPALRPDGARRVSPTSAVFLRSAHPQRLQRFGDMCWQPCVDKEEGARDGRITGGRLVPCCWRN